MEKHKHILHTFKSGLLTGLFLQLAIGPVFFYIVNLALQKSLLDGLVAVLAVTIVDYFYISLSILGIGTILKQKRVKRIVAILSSIILMIFGVLILSSVVYGEGAIDISPGTDSVWMSFLSTIFLTVTNPMTIVFFTGIFSAKATENNYTKDQLLIFGLSAGLATFLFMGTSVVIFSFIKEAVPVTLIHILNTLVGIVLLVYGFKRIVNIFRKVKKMNLPARKRRPCC